MRRFYTAFILLLCQVVHGQINYELTFKGDDYREFIKHPKTEFKDSAAAANYLIQFKNTAIQDGFLLMSIDSIEYKRNHAEVTIHVGPKFSDAQIEIDPKELDFITRFSSLNEKTIAHLPVSPSELARDLERIFNVYVNNGYPFAQISLTKVAIYGSQLSAQLTIERGPLYRWKAINIRGDSSISAVFISNIIQIHPEDVYNEANLKKISQRINQIPFLEELKAHEILFTPEGAELFIYVKSVPISSINGIIGFQPNPNTQKLAFTGEIHLKLLNVLNRGELLDIKWQSIRDQTQSLNSRVNYPFLFRTPFGIDGSFDLYKRDTSFLELNSTIGVQYFLNKGSYLKAFYQRISSSVLTGGKNNPQFSKLGSTSSNSYGLAYSRQQLDYLPNPSKGITVQFTGSVGSRSSLLSDTSQTVKSLIYRSNLELSYFLPLARRHVLRFGLQTELYAADNIFENELYRFGGLSSQRGFNEDELFATSRATGTLEYRFLLDRNSHVFAFYDQTWYENNASAYYNDAPFGLGVGFSFSTNLGVFSISYALGKQFNNPVLISNSKVHFGYIAYFQFMDYILLIIGLIIGTFVGFLIAKVRGNGDHSFKDEHAQLSIEKATLTNVNQRMAEDISVLKSEVESAREKHQIELRSATEWRSKFESLEEKMHAQKEELESLQTKFTKEFELVANKILEEKSSRFTDQNKKNIDEILNPLKERITEFQKKVEDSNEKHIERSAHLDQHLKMLHSLNQEITQETKSLTQALRGDSKTQGNWGEMHLETILEKAGLQKDIHYTKETNLKTEEGANQRLDYIINLPDGKKLILDSKVSLTAYSNLYSTEDQNEKARYLADHLTSVNAHIKLLGSKDYQKLHGINSPDYVLMFVANEPALTLALKEDQSLFEKALEKNIVLVSTSTLLATLRTISYIWKQDLQNRNAEEIARQAASLYDKFVSFSGDLVKLGNQLDTANTTYRESMKKLSEGKDNLVRKTERLKELGVNPSKSIDNRLIDRSE